MDRYAFALILLGMIVASIAIATAWLWYSAYDRADRRRIIREDRQWRSRMNAASKPDIDAD